MKNILILYNEVMPYNVAAYMALIKYRPDVEIDIFSWNEDKKLTPYKAPAIERVNYNQEKDYLLKDLIECHRIRKYQVVYICGRSENKYLNFALYLRKNCKKTIVIGQTDEQFYGNLKQLIVKIFFRVLYKRYFNKIFVPGYFQYEYMRYMGFKKNEILIGAYTADIEPFNQHYLNSRYSVIEKKRGLKLLFLGRLEVEKGILPLLKEIEIINSEGDAAITIKIIGNGSLLSQITGFPFVEHYHFADQPTIINLLHDVDFFILPSIYEPWGVVIHEMAAAGMPIICSDQCGARSAMVVDNYNGFIFNASKTDTLKKALANALCLSEARMIEFRKRSFELSKTVTPDIWAETISSFIQ